MHYRYNLREGYVMGSESRNSKIQYSAEFKEQAVGLANEIGTSRAAEKLGINKVQALSA